jgi:hypothetical protein
MTIVHSDNSALEHYGHQIGNSRPPMFLTPSIYTSLVPQDRCKDEFIAPAELNSG